MEKNHSENNKLWILRRKKHSAPWRKVPFVKKIVTSRQSKVSIVSIWSFIWNGGNWSFIWKKKKFIAKKNVSNRQKTGSCHRKKNVRFIHTRKMIQQTCFKIQCQVRVQSFNCGKKETFINLSIYESNICICGHTASAAVAVVTWLLVILLWFLFGFFSSILSSDALSWSSSDMVGNKCCFFFQVVSWFNKIPAFSNEI